MEKLLDIHVEKPRLAIVGRGRAGKDTVGEWFGKNTNLRYIGSTSNIVCPMIAAELGISEDEAWNDRHNNRMFWKDWCDKYREEDPALIIKACLAKGDIVVGVRDILEINALRDQKLVDLILWIERDVPPDPTVAFTSEVADIMIPNNGTLEQLYERLENFARFAWLI